MVICLLLEYETLLWKGSKPKVHIFGHQLTSADSIKTSTVDLTWQTHGAIGTLSFKLMCLQRSASFYKTLLILLHFPCLYYVNRLFGDLCLSEFAYSLFTEEWMSSVIFLLWITFWYVFFYKAYVILICQWLLWNPAVQNTRPIVF